MDGSDSSLVARVLSGEEEAFRALVERHGRNVFRLSYRLTGSEEDAEDVVQETFIRAYRSLPRFEGKSEFGSWLYRITTNCALDLLRKRAPAAAATSEPELSEETPSAGASPERAALGGEIARRLKVAMTRLTPKERTAFVLRHFEGRPIVEIAATLGIREGATKACVFRAVEKLRAELGHLMPSSPASAGVAR
ncbi:MAG TPA: RNA polymerase sigma factor [Thermoanaerobaculia bacterium]|jgi:RNA polymerase sigma-70 factor (ECF subfamily)|nr:RNA polymerase sigma factor [Thermoanaerobaculia bacterium]